MTSEQLQHFRHKLEEQRNTLGARIADARIRAEEPIERTGGEAGDVGDASVRDVDVDTQLELGESRTRQLEEIEDALLRIELGEYGICEVCGRPIELDRLEVMPAARLCKNDARHAEIRKPPTL